MMDMIGEQVLALFQNAREKALVVAPFIKEKSFRRLVEKIPVGVKIEVFTRWEIHEIASGVSDLRVFDLAKDIGADLFLRRYLHAKLFAADNKCLIGSANVTHAALGWRKPSNLELVVPIERDHPYITSFEHTLRTSSIRASRSYRDLLQSAVENISINEINADGISESNEDEFVSEPFLNWYPRVRNPNDLFGVYKGISGKEEMGSKFHDMQQELEELGVPEGLEDHEFRSWIGYRIAESPIVMGVLSILENQENIEDRIGELLQTIGVPSSIPPMSVIETLFRWISFFHGVHYQFDSSMRIIES